MRVLTPLLLLVGCAGFEPVSIRAGDPAPEGSPLVFHAPAPDDRAGAASTEEPTAPGEQASKIVRTADLQITVEDHAGFARALTAWLEGVGGYVADSSVDGRDGAEGWATWTVRVPAERFDALVGWTEERVEVRSIQVQRRDVTEGWVDLTARLTNARRQEASLLELLDDRTGTLADVLAVERELARVRGEIEAQEGRLRVLDDTIVMSTVTIGVRIERPYATLVRAPFADRAAEVFAGSVDTMGVVAEGLTLVAVAASPWLVPPFVLVGGVVLAARRRHRSRSATVRIGC